MPRCWKTFDRNRPRPGTLYARSTSCACRNFSRCSSRKMAGRHRLGVVPIQALFFGRDDERAVHAHHRVAPDLEMHVGGAAGDRYLEQVVDVHGPGSAYFFAAAAGSSATAAVRGSPG